MEFPNCLLCEHFGGDTDEPTCKAFPQAIPQKIWTNEVLHNDPIKGDRGFQYKDDPALLRKEKKDSKPDPNRLGGPVTITTNPRSMKRIKKNLATLAKEGTIDERQ